MTTKYASTAPALNSTTARLTNVYAKRFSFAYKPGVMKPQSWANQIGLDIRTPAVAATLSRRVNCSNTPNATRRHSWPPPSCTRFSGGSAQYGSVRICPSDGSPNG